MKWTFIWYYYLVQHDVECKYLYTGILGDSVSYLILFKIPVPKLPTACACRVATETFLTFLTFLTLLKQNA